jgi:ATP-dependent DNA ligase
MRPRAFEPYPPTHATALPANRDWFHDIKHDGYRLNEQAGKGAPAR